MSGPSRGERAGVELEHGPAPEDGLELGAAQDQPGPSSQRGPAWLHDPAAAHPQMRSEDDAALEAKDQVLADRLDRLERPAVEPLGDPLGLGARVRRRDLDPLPTSGCSRAAARWSVSPSGTVGEEALRAELEPLDRPFGARAESLSPKARARRRAARRRALPGRRRRRRGARRLRLRRSRPRPRASARGCAGARRRRWRTRSSRRGR